MKERYLKKQVRGWYAEAEPPADPPAPAEITIEIDGKPVTKTADDIQSLIASQAAVTQKSQQVSDILAAAAKFNMTPQEFVNQAEGSFAVIQEAIDKGLIDNEGNVLDKKPTKSTEAAPVIPGAPHLQTPEITETLSAAQKALASIQATEKRIENLERDQSHLFKMDLEKKIFEKHPALTQKDVSDVFVSAMNDPEKKGVWHHAETIATAKTAGMQSLREAHAQEFGVNLEEFDANKLKQQDSGGGAAGFAKGKKFSFRKGKRRSEDGVSPKQAMQEFLSQQK